MKIQCIDRKTFELTDSSKKLGHITYDSLFSSKANAIVGNDTYKITPIGVFNTTISVTKNDKEVLNKLIYTSMVFSRTLICHSILYLIFLLWKPAVSQRLPTKPRD
jgi:hypothetical protein